MTDQRIGPAFPDNNALNYNKFPGFEQSLKTLQENADSSFSVKFPEDFDMSGEYVITFPNGKEQRHPMVCVFFNGISVSICYHPHQVVNMLIAKQNTFKVEEGARHIQEMKEEEESKKNIEDIKAKLAALDALDDEDD